MQLNTIAGRTYNDLGQYPVFPWILSNYIGKQLDLTTSQSYRQLAYPIGAQLKEQRDAIKSRYRDLLEAYEVTLAEEAEMREARYDDQSGSRGMPPFHWGSHYSVAGFVLWYLVRLEPFTSLHVQVSTLLLHLLMPITPLFYCI